VLFLGGIFDAFLPLVAITSFAHAEAGWIAEAIRGMVNQEEYYSEDGAVLLELEPDELFIFTTNQKIYEKSTAARERLIGQYIREKFPRLKNSDWFTGTIWVFGRVISKYPAFYPDLVLGTCGPQYNKNY